MRQRVCQLIDSKIRNKLASASVWYRLNCRSPLGVNWEFYEYCLPLAYLRIVANSLVARKGELTKLLTGLTSPICLHNVKR